MWCDGVMDDIIAVPPIVNPNNPNTPNNKVKVLFIVFLAVALVILAGSMAVFFWQKSQPQELFPSFPELGTLKTDDQQTTMVRGVVVKKLSEGLLLNAGEEEGQMIVFLDKGQEITVGAFAQTRLVWEEAKVGQMVEIRVPEEARKFGRNPKPVSPSAQNK